MYGGQGMHTYIAIPPHLVDGLCVGVVKPTFQPVAEGPRVLQAEGNRQGAKPSRTLGRLLARVFVFSVHEVWWLVFSMG